MADLNLKELADTLYSSFLARDFFAKVIRGGLVLGSFVLSVPGSTVDLSQLSKELPLFALFFYGICWGLGFAIQYFGYMTKLIESHPKKFRDRIKGTMFPVDGETYQANFNRFLKCNPDHFQRIQRERYVVIKEACGKFAMALLLITVLLCLHMWTGTQWKPIWLAISIFLTASFYFGFNRARKSEFSWIIDVIRESGKEPIFFRGN